MKYVFAAIIALVVITVATCALLPLLVCLPHASRSKRRRVTYHPHEPGYCEACGCTYVAARDIDPASTPREHLTTLN